MKQALFAIICAVLLAACSTTTSTSTVRTPNGERTVTFNEGPYSRDRSETVDSTRAYKDCLAQRNARLDPNAEQYCRSVTAVGPFGAVSIPGVGPGMGAMMGPAGYDPGPVILMMDGSTPASRAMERATGQSVVVDVPVNGMGPGTGAPAQQNEDLDLVLQAIKTQQEQICELQKAQGQPCSQQPQQ